MSTGPSMSMIENSVNAGSISVGNYKGVMLCNRPFGGSTAVNKQANAPVKQTFTAGVVPETIGQNVPIAAKEKQTKRPKKDSVLAKHKKWLLELQMTKNRLEEQYIEEMKRKEEQQAKFQEHEKKMRLMSKSILQESREAKQQHSADSKDAKDSPSRPGNSSNNYDSDEKGSSSGGDAAAAQAKAPSSSSGKGGGGGGGGFKPAWAMTEEAADQQLDDMMAAEEEGLLDFAKSLDFDKYMGDIEVQTMMERLRSRISQLEREVALEDMRDLDVHERAALRAKLEQMGKAEASLWAEHGAEQSAESKALAEARALLTAEEGKEVAGVHSAKSATALLQQAKDKIETVRQAAQPLSATAPAATDSGSTKIKNEPLIVVHEPNEGARLGDKNDISNLPYMHRNPAV